MNRPIDREKYLTYERIAFAALVEKGLSPTEIRDKMEMNTPTFYRRLAELRKARMEKSK